MTPSAEPTPATPPRQARRRVCSGVGCRWWPAQEPHEIGDGPAMSVCLTCADMVALQKVMPSKR